MNQITFAKVAPYQKVLRKWECDWIERSREERTGYKEEIESGAFKLVLSFLSQKNVKFAWSNALAYSLVSYKAINMYVKFGSYSAVLCICTGTMLHFNVMC